MEIILKILGILLLLLILSYFLGPKAKFEKVDGSPQAELNNIAEAIVLVNKENARTSNIKPDNQSQFIWVDSLKKTEYAFLYLHGFSASHGESEPIITNLAHTYACNTYLPRLYLHGLNDVDAFAKLNPKDLVESAKKAIAIGKAIGEKLIIVSCSTGSTLATYLAAFDDDIEAMIMTSPNFDLYDQNSHLLLKPWGKQIFRQMMGGNYRQWDASPDINKYWTTKNRIEAHIAIRSLLDQTMIDDIFKKIDIPIYAGYFFVDENKMDKIISIDAIKHFEKTISTPKENIKIVPFDNARGHVISSKYMNKNWENVQFSIFDFCENVIGLKRAHTTYLPATG